MAISGILEASSNDTLHIVLESLRGCQEPGVLRLRHLTSGKLAGVRFDQGRIEETVCGDLRGEAALREIATTYPWEYEFVSAVQKSGMAEAAATDQPSNRPVKRPALKLAGAVKPMMLHRGEIDAGGGAGVPDQEAKAMTSGPERKSVFMQARHQGQQNPVPTPPAADEADSSIPPPPVRRMPQWPRADRLAAWVQGSDEFAIRFARSGQTVLGRLEPPEWEYFRADSTSLMLWAAGIGETLGYSPPVVVALVEPQRAAGYRRLEDGFAGIYCGPETPVDSIVDIP